MKSNDALMLRYFFVSKSDEFLYALFWQGTGGTRAFANAAEVGGDRVGIVGSKLGIR